MSQLSASRASDLAVAYKSYFCLYQRLQREENNVKKGRPLIPTGSPENYFVTKANKEVKTKGEKRKKHGKARKK